MIRIYSILAAGMVVVLLAGLGVMVWYGQRAQGDQFAQCRATSIAGGSGAIGGPFELVDQTGARVTEQTLLQKPVLIYFGYTFCPDVCPLDNARNAEIADILEDRGYDLTPVFITVDPARDTVEYMADFVRWQHPRMIGLTGTEEQVRKAAQAYRVYYASQQGDDDYYLVDHTTFSYLMLPEHGFVDILRREISPEAGADMISCYLDNA